MPGETGANGGKYIDALMRQLYERSHNEAALSEPDTQLRDLTILARIRLQMSHLKDASLLRTIYPRPKIISSP